MSEIKDRMKKKIIRWLDEERQHHLPAEIEDQRTELAISIPINNQDVMNVIFRGDFNDSVMLAGQVSFSNLNRAVFHKLQFETKSDFFFELNYSLLHLGVEYSFVPNERNMELTRIKKTIYFDRLTKSNLFETILLIRRGIKIVRLCYLKYLQR